MWSHGKKQMDLDISWMEQKGKFKLGENDCESMTAEVHSFPQLEWS